MNGEAERPVPGLGLGDLHLASTPRSNEETVTVRDSCDFDQHSAERCRASKTIWLPVFIAVLIAGCDGPNLAAPLDPPEVALVAIPSEPEWRDCGPIFEAGGEGEWDYLLRGGFAISVIKSAGIYRLYYHGSERYDDGLQTVAWRSIGLATSTDGLTFSKYVGNPVLTWFPGPQLEEGATSAAAVVGTSGQIELYYGANSWAATDQVTADGRLALSRNGVDFVDAGLVLDHRDQAVWGAGDELFPIIALQVGTRRIVYYIPNGSLQGGQLGVAWGNGSALNTSAGALSDGASIETWGGGGVAKLGPTTFALFLSKREERDSWSVSVRTASSDTPDRVSQPAATYTWRSAGPSTVLLDDEAGRWFLYYRTSTGYGVRVALTRAADETPSPPPADLCGGTE